MAIAEEYFTGPTKMRRVGSRDLDSLYVSLVPLPAAFFIATLVSDLLYWRTTGAFWWAASEWMLGAGLATGAYAAADGLTRYVLGGAIRPSRTCWIHVVGNLLALLLSLSNLVYRLYADSHTVVPAGMGLTATVVCLLIFTARLGRDVAVQSRAHDLDDDDDSFWDELAEPSAPEPQSPQDAQGAAVPARQPAKKRRARTLKSASGQLTPHRLDKRVPPT